MTTNVIGNENDPVQRSTWVNALVILASILFFIFSIRLMGSSIASFGRDFADYTIGATANPFIGLFIGLLATALLQSSSTTTSIAVAAVASGAISLQSAIPIVMGANIGTTITSTVISMGYISRAKEFRRAVAAGTSHDFFNIIMVLLLFPIEYKFRFLEKLSQSFTALFSSLSPSETSSGTMLPTLLQPLNDAIIQAIGPTIALLFGIVLLFLCLKLISKWIYDILIGKTRERFKNTVFKTKFRSFSWGLVTTSIAQSSSLTTSLIVPLVATGKVKVNKAFQFILGANLGTTITALLAASFQSEAAISLAIVHLLFNFIGVTLFLLVPFLGRIPVYLANKFGDLTYKTRLIGFVYILTAFFLIPFTLIYLSNTPSEEKEKVALEIQPED